MARMTPWREWTGTLRGVVLCSLLAFGIGVTAAVRFAPDSPMRRLTNEESATEHEARQAKAFYERAWSGVRTVQLRDSLRALARPGVSFLLDSRIPRDRRAVAEERLRTAWGAFAISAPRVPVVLYLRAPVTPATRRTLADPTFASLPMAPGEPCVAVLAAPGAWRTVSRDARYIRYSLYGCALMAEHGLPGAGVRAELRRVAWSPSPLNLERRFWYFSISGTVLDAIFAREDASAAAYFACLAGKVSACGELAARPTNRAREYPPGTNRTGRVSNDAALLALLKASLSPAAFSRLWRDERSFEVAVADITGRPAGDWMHVALLRASRPLKASFSSTVPIISRALLFLLLAVAASVAMQSRRTVR